MIKLKYNFTTIPFSNGSIFITSLLNFKSSSKVLQLNQDLNSVKLWLTKTVSISLARENLES